MIDVYGIDFTSRPRRSKPLTYVKCTYADHVLTVRDSGGWPDYISFEQALLQPGPWVMGIDFPFSQSRRFIENSGWPQNWADYVAHVAGLDRAGFRREMDQYRRGRAVGDKEHRRQTDMVTGAASPQKLHMVPVGLMFFEGAPRLARAGVTIPHLQQGDPARVAMEAYPGVLARQIIGKRSYKQDIKSKQTADQRAAREDIFAALCDPAHGQNFGLTVVADPKICEDPQFCNDPKGDRLDALLCAVQAAWSWQRRRDNYGAPADVDPLEGWIAGPIPD